MTLEPVSRAILVVDMEKSSERTDTGKADLRAVLYRVLHDALDAADLPAGRRRLDDLGDGVLAVADSEVLPLLDPLPDVVSEGLARHNAGVRAEAWLRLRLGVHFGLVARDEHGWVGDAMTTAFRIVNGAGVKSVLKAAGRAQSVVVVSDPVHDAVVRHGYRGIRPESYGKLVDEGRTVWVRVPGYVQPPLPGDAPKPTGSATGKVFNAYNNGHVFNADTMNVDARIGFGGTS
ncbi:adenylate/guanylate cyclase domain-containing protein [Saccharothrix sp. NRRL B-16314]|uniref:adenylate/guanylate cyclase domain-containing protein n=1 Tax=Saccharothrix sp. NRRL B-16314 TaxID=1463825 RepID=UPI0012DE2CC4|nr:adenylate/guanylate cyclase domain-containing protein [Saccharothrix sp. NRRL B-16314]